MKITRRAATAGLLALAAPLPATAATPNDAPLIVSAAKMAVETAPIRLALRNLYGESAEMPNGGVIALVGGKKRMADLGSNGEAQALRQSVHEPGMRVIMTVAEGHYPLIARRSAGINSLADLKGKRILNYQRTTGGYFLHKMLKTVGLTMADVTLVEIPLGKVGEVAARKEVDAVAIWEPDSEQALRSLRLAGEDVTIFSGNGIYHERYNLCTTADALANSMQRRKIVALMRAIIAANVEMNRNPAIAAQAQAMVAKAGGLYTAEEVALAWPYVKFVASFDEGLLDIFTEEEIWLADIEKRKPRSREKLARLIDRSAFDEAVTSQ
jgi:NitT/TauT family transport system substrate-binding protein